MRSQKDSNSKSRLLRLTVIQDFNVQEITGNTLTTRGATTQLTGTHHKGYGISVKIERITVFLGCNGKNLYK